MTRDLGLQYLSWKTTLFKYLLLQARTTDDLYQPKSQGAGESTAIWEYFDFLPTKWLVDWLIDWLIDWLSCVLRRIGNSPAL